MSVNRRVASLLGVRREELLGKDLREILAPEARDDFGRYLEEIVEMGTASGVMKVVAQSGDTRLLEYHNALRAGDHSRPLIWGVAVDVTDRYRMQRDLELQKAFFQQLFDVSPLAIALLDNHDRVRAANRGFEELFRYPIDEIRGRPINELIVPDTHRDEATALSATVLEEKGVQAESVRQRRDGSLVHVSILGQRIELGSEGLGIYAIYRDISDRVRAEEKIRSLAFYDPLTGLPNRRRFTDRLRGAMRTAREKSRGMALLFIDLDQFKRINDTFGHNVGDQLLRQVAERLVGVVRLSDYVGRSEPDTEPASISRLGGDEFTVLLKGLLEPADVAKIGQRILSAFSRPYRVGGREVYSTASIGIALYPADARDADTLLRNADAAMYLAKSEGRNTCRFFTNELNQMAERRIDLETRMRQAMDREDISLVYQGVYRSGDRRLTGVESLVRWTDPELGAVSPAEFVPIAEETGLIMPLGEWILRQGCADAMTWQRAGLRSVRLTVNLSGHQLLEKGFQSSVVRCLTETGLRPSQLELEIRESAIIERSELAAEILSGIKKMGVSLALDDFGVGPSSLSSLLRLPLDRIKLDGSFVGELLQAEDQDSLMASIIELAHRRGLQVVAEGVESSEEADHLSRLGCDELQGFHFGPPVSAEEFAGLLEQE